MIGGKRLSPAGAVGVCGGSGAGLGAAPMAVAVPSVAVAAVAVGGGGAAAPGGVVVPPVPAALLVALPALVVPVVGRSCKSHRASKASMQSFQFVEVHHQPILFTSPF